MKSQVGYQNRSPRQFANDLLAMKSFERGEAIAWHAPVEVYLQVASACNLDCYMCYEHLRPPQFRRGKGLKALTPELYAKIEREVFPYSTKVTFGVGGEPMLCPHLLDYVERAFRANQHVHLMTNGTRITSDRVAETLARCLSSMEVSIDAATAETYERIRAGSRWDRLLANFERLNRFRLAHPPAERTHLTLCFVMMKSNVHELPQFVELGRLLHADRIAAWHVIPVTEEGKRESLHDDRERSDRWLSEARARARELEIEVDLVKPFHAQDGESALEVAGSRQGAITRARLAAEGTEEEAWARPLTGQDPDGPERPRRALEPRPAAARSRDDGRVPAQEAPLPAELRDSAGAPPSSSLGEVPDAFGGEFPLEETLSSEPEVDPATGVLRGSAWRPLADPPDPERAAQAMREFEARPKGRRLFCHMPTLTLYVFYDGRVFPCCHPHAHTKLPMGDLSRQSFREIWNGRAYRNLRAGLELGDPPPLCQRCSLMQSPPPVMENPGELEGQAASLGSYYGELDLEPLPTGLELSAMGDSSGAADGGSGSEAPREALAREQRWREAAVEREREVLVLHMRALETHIKNLEGERAHQLGHIKNLERILGKIHGIPIYRTLCKVKDAALFWAPRSRSISRSESESRSER